MAFKNFVLICVVVCSIGIDAQSYETVRNVRQRRPISYLDSDEVIEDSFVSGNSKRPIYIEGGNQWKPMFNIPPTTRTITKFRTKPHIYTKYQQSNNINPSEYFPKTYQPTTATFIANQTLLVADPHERIIKPSPSYKKPKYQYVPKKHYSSQTYEVHEESEEVPDYISHNQFRFPLPKPGQATTKPILYSEMIGHKSKPKPIQYSEMVGSEKHIHHMHYHDSMEEALKASSTKSGRQYRGYPSDSRKYY